MIKKGNFLKKKTNEHEIIEEDNKPNYFDTQNEHYATKHLARSVTARLLPVDANTLCRTNRRLKRLRIPIVKGDGSIVGFGQERRSLHDRIAGTNVVKIFGWMNAKPNQNKSSVCRVC